MIDWKRKLSSRKFWLAVIGFITPLMYMFKMSTSDVENVASIIMSGALLIAYILSEGWIDASREGADVYVIEETVEDEVI